MEGLFKNIENFNRNINNWDVSNVTNMKICFMVQFYLIKILIIGTFQM
jgi:surface protein